MNMFGMGSHPVVARTLHQAVLLAIGDHFLDVAPGSDRHKRKGYPISIWQLQLMTYPGVLESAPSSKNAAFDFKSKCRGPLQLWVILHLFYGEPTSFDFLGIFLCMLDNFDDVVNELFLPRVKGFLETRCSQEHVCICSACTKQMVGCTSYR